MLSAIVVICLMALAFGLAARAVGIAIGATGRLSETARSQVAFSRVDAMLVRSAARIRQPLWLGRPEFRANGNEIAVSYLDGDPESVLSLYWDDDGVTLSAGGTSAVFRGLSVTGAAVVAQPPAHLVISFVAEPESQLTITAPFGLFPIPQP